MLFFSVGNVFAQSEPTLSSSPSPTITLPLYPKGVTWHVDRRWRNATTGAIDWQGVETDLQDLVAADIRHVRTIWQQGVRTNEDNDRLVALLSQYGIQMIPTIYHIPQKTAGTETERAVYRSWLAEQINRYKHYIRTWEAYNEPNGPSFWNIDISDTSDQTEYEASVQDYITFLQDTYFTIKENDPTTTVISAGLSEWKVERWLDAFIKFQGYLYIDAITFHPYGNSPDNTVIRLNALKAKMATNSIFAEKPIYITEIGYHTRTSDNPGMYVPTEEIKGEYLRQTLEKLRLGGVHMPIYWYTYEDAWTTENGAGIVAKTGNTLESTVHLPAYYAYKSLWSDTNIAILNPMADAYVDSSLPGANFGLAPTLYSYYLVGRRTVAQQLSYLQFDLSSLAGKTINQTLLKLKTTSADDAGSGGVHSIRRVEDAPWTETGITFADRPQVLTESIGGVVPASVSKWYDATINPSFFQAYSGSLPTIAVDTTSRDNAVFFSGEAIYSSLPQLIVYYNLGSTTPLDWASPSTFITYPENGAVVKVGSTVNITAEAFDNTGIARVEFYINGTLACTATAPVYTCPLNVSSKTGIKYTLTSTAYDPAGNKSSHTIVVRSGK